MIKEWIVGDEDENKVLDTCGDWTLEKMGNYSDIRGTSNKARYKSLIKHKCMPKHHNPLGEPYSTPYQVVVYPDDNDQCWRCYEKIPTKMVVLWTFMNDEPVLYRKRQYGEGGWRR